MCNNYVELEVENAVFSKPTTDCCSYREPTALVRRNRDPTSGKLRWFASVAVPNGRKSSQIVDYKTVYLGRFDTEEQAAFVSRKV